MQKEKLDTIKSNEMPVSKLKCSLQIQCKNKLSLSRVKHSERNKHYLR